ncbi:16S rRNA (cytidine(1402)-2'-O)-methyltransferase [Christensenellaceae bacterium OttesenSCG-928-K19]|nr:16S rRNA (cytidine(1402)-2'-O)-methyltransferase [Christensenellaceae bacterium OttesenSCG-928-K19]
MATGKLYIVATPIGNLKDITLRALETLREVDFIAAEDTRHTIKLLNHYEIKKKTVSFHEYSDEKRLNEVLDMLAEGKSCALCSDAGTPVISDPGFILIKRCAQLGIEMESIPGPCAAISAVALSGIDCRRFLFAGFLPSKQAARQSELASLRGVGVPIVLYESPARVVRTLEDICAVFGDDTPVCVARELTKLYEEVVRLPARQVLQLFADRSSIKGEFVLVVGAVQKEAATDMEIIAALKDCVARGMAKKEAVTTVTAMLSCPKNKVYKLSLTI